MTTAHTTTSTPDAADTTPTAPITSADRRQDRRQQEANNQHPRWRIALSWAGFAVGCAVLVLCAFIVKNSTHWNPHMGGPIWSFLILFALMLIAGLLIMGGITTAIGWVKKRLDGTGDGREQ